MIKSSQNELEKEKELKNKKIMQGKKKNLCTDICKYILEKETLKDIFAEAEGKRQK